MIQAFRYHEDCVEVEDEIPISTYLNIFPLCGVAGAAAVVVVVVPVLVG